MLRQDFSDADVAYGRRLEEEVGDDVAEVLAVLMDKTMTFMIAFPVILGMHALTHFLWKYKVNNRFYYELLLPRLTKHADKPAARFVPMPGIFVFPSFASLACGFFVTGFVEASVEVVATCAVRQESGAEAFACMIPGLIVLMFCLAFLITAFTMVYHYHKVHAPEVWEDLEVPDDADDVTDPLYRWVSKLRVRLFPKDKKYLIMERERGEFVRDDEEVEEPRRTERILNNPISIYRNSPADALDSMKVFLMNRSSWSKRNTCRAIMGITYDVIQMYVQCMIAAVAGLGPIIEVGTASATLQIVVILMLQLGISFYIIFAGVSVDRIDQWITGFQFMFEGVVTLLTLATTMTTDEATIAGLQTGSFWLSIFAMMMPTIEKAYDLFVTQISKVLRYKKEGGEISFKAIGFACCAFAFTVPTLILGILGLEGGDLGDGLAEINDAADASMDDIIDGLGGLADVGGNLFWITNPKPKHHRDAIKLQRAARKRIVQARHRQHMAACKLQAAYRGRAIRDRLDLKGVVAMAKDDRKESELASKAAAAEDARPGMGWLWGTLKDDLRRERLDRARESLQNSRKVRLAESADLRSKAAALDGTRLKVDKRTMSFGKVEKRLNKLEKRAMSFAPRKPRAKLQTDRTGTEMTAPQTNAIPTHDSHLSRVGVLYSRAKPKTGDEDDFRETIARLRTRKAKMALPAFMPPSLPTHIAAEFADVVYQTEKVARAQGNRPNMGLRPNAQSAARRAEIKQEIEKEVDRLRRQEVAVRSLPLHMPHDDEGVVMLEDDGKRRTVTKRRTAAPVPAAPPPTSRRSSSAAEDAGNFLSGLFGFGGSSSGPRSPGKSPGGRARTAPGGSQGGSSSRDGDDLGT